MAEFWNEFDVKLPPLITLPTKNTKYVRRLQTAIKEYLELDSGQEKEFAETAALLSRLMARRKNSFRRMAGFKAIQKLNAANLRLLRVDLKREVERLKSALPDFVFDEEVLLDVEMPSRNNLDYVLVRLVGVHGIHDRIQQCCIEAADYFAKMIRTCFFLEINTLLLAVFAKLRKLSMNLGNKCVDFYGALLLHRDYLPQRGSYQFLPEHIELPTKLNTFKGSEEEYTENDPLTIDTSKLATVERKRMTAVISKSKQQTKQLDMGTSIQRDHKASPENVLKHLNTIEDIQKFIASETKRRKQSLSKSLTKNVLNHEWLGAQKLFERKIKANQHKKAFSIFCKFLSSKI